MENTTAKTYYMHVWKDVDGKQIPIVGSPFVTNREDIRRAVENAKMYGMHINVVCDGKSVYTA